MRIAGVSTAIAALGAVFQSKTTSNLHTLFPHAPAGFADGVAGAGSRATAPPPQPHDQAFRRGRGVIFNDIPLIGA
jgi:hypothetical protein